MNKLSLADSEAAAWQNWFIRLCEELEEPVTCLEGKYRRENRETEYENVLTAFSSASLGNCGNRKLAVLAKKRLALLQKAVKTGKLGGNQRFKDAILDPVGMWKKLHLKEQEMLAHAI